MYTTGRKLELTFVCDETTDPYDIPTLNCGEYDPICDYWYTIRTKHACVGGSSNDESDGLSPGYIFIILLCVGIILYCVGGFIFNGMRNPNEEGKWTDLSYNIPNLPFWKILPQLVMAGCTETTNWVKGKSVKKMVNQDKILFLVEGDVDSESEYQ